jgi:hypothetical protein
MKKFLKKVVYFDVVYNITNIFFSNILWFKNGKIFQVIIDSWTLVFLIGWFFCGIVGVGLIKYFGAKTNKFIYESDEFICFSAFLLRSLRWVNASFIDFLDNHFWGGATTLFDVICFVMIILVLYYFWKYRFEISASLFLTSTIYAFTHLEIPFYSIFHIIKPNDFQRGLFILGILALFLPTVIFLRNKGLWDIRPRKDKRLEADGEGLYRKISK